MNILQRIGNALISFGKDDLEPWLKSFLTSVAHAAVNVAATTGTTFVEQALPALTSAAASGDWNGFADAQNAVIKTTFKQLVQDEEKVSINEVTTAVNALISGHPAVVAAVASAPAPAVTTLDSASAPAS